MPTTSNFGWTTPADTDLVKDGAAAIRTLGNGIDTSLVDLKGGTTGQYLVKQSNTDLDFTWTTNTADIDGITATSPLTGGGTSGTITVGIQDGTTAQKGAVQLTDSISSTSTTTAATPNSVKTAYDLANGAIAKSLVDAKADLITATADDTPARLAVGNNGETLVADSSATTGLRWQSNYAAGKNKIINGDFGIWQRGTSFNTSGNYTADRFFVNSDATFTASQQTFTPASAPVAGYEGTYFLQIAKSAGGSFVDARQRIEDVRTFAGQTVTLSAWMKVSSGTASVEPYILQNFGSGGSAGVGNAPTGQTINTTWTRYSWTVSLASVSGKTIGTSSYLEIYLPRIVTSATGAITVSIWGVQLEAGNTATAFQTATGTLAGEFQACRRYYQRFGGSEAYEFIGQGFAGSTTSLSIPLNLDTPLRTKPTSVDFSTLAWWVGGAVTSITAAALQNNSNSQYKPMIQFTTTGLTSLATYGVLTNNSTSGYVAVSAEL